jgi:hypothetical protein
LNPAVLKQVRVVELYQPVVCFGFCFHFVCHVSFSLLRLHNNRKRWRKQAKSETIFKPSLAISVATNGQPRTLVQIPCMSALAVYCSESGKKWPVVGAKIFQLFRS